MTNTKPTIVSAEPQLFVADILSSCAFFIDKLGFAVVFTYGEPPFYAQVRRDGASLTLRHVDAPVIDPALRDREELLSASLTVATRADIEALSRVRGERRQFLPAAEGRALGRARFHRQ